LHLRISEETRRRVGAVIASDLGDRLTGVLAGGAPEPWRFADSRTAHSAPAAASVCYTNEALVPHHPV
jgi:hypothetical protein